ncbi:MAG: hypothetical protein ACE5GN_06030, partial [Waddliaceae bacterium]
HRAISEQIMNYYQQTEEYGIRGVLYFDDATNRLHALLENGNSVDIGTTDPDVIQKKTGLTPRELFTFYDQSHTTGIDIRQEMQANAIITISETTPCSHLLQGAMRMRELGKLQRVHYALNESLLDREGKFPNVRDLLVRTIVNEATKRGGEHWKSAQDQMDNVLRRSILEEVLDTKGVQEVIDKVDEGGEVFFQDTTTDLYLRSKAPKIPRDSKKMLAERRDQLEQTKDRIAQRKRYRDVGTALSRSCQDGWDKVFGRLYPEDGASLIPEKIIASGEQGITLDVQSRQQQEMELDREKQIASVTTRKSVQEREIKRSDVRESTIREGKFVDNSDLLSKKWRPLFSEEPCFFVTNHFAEQLVSPVPDQMWGIATQMLVSKTPDGQYRLTVLHGYEAEYYAKKIQESDEDLWLVDVAGNFVRKPKEPAPDLTDSGLVAQLQQIQLFQGRLGLIMKSKNPPEWLVKTYTREPELFRAFLKECVFPNFPIAKEAEKRFLRWLISKSKA